MTGRQRSALLSSMHYHIFKKEYYIRSHDTWIPQSEAQTKRRLKAAGLPGRAAQGQLLSSADEMLVEIQDLNAVHYAGPLAGYRCGIHEMCGKRILITEEAAFIEPQSGDWSVLKKTFEAILLDEEFNQLNFFYGWLKVALSSFLGDGVMPGQVLVMAGEVGCGKSLVQNLITQILGGRAARPYQFMVGQTSFNSELFGAEHLVVEDEAPSSDNRSKRTMTSLIKQLTVNEEQRFHAKNQDALILRPKWRTSITVNDDHEALMVLPALEPGIYDKMILLQARKRQLPCPTGTVEARNNFWDMLCAQLPQFIHFILNEFQIPDDLLSERYGITHFHHPNLVKVLGALSKEKQLLKLIDTYILGNQQEIVLRAEEIEVALRNRIGWQIKEILSTPASCGTLLGLLHKSSPERVLPIRTSKRRKWKIVQP